MLLKYLKEPVLAGVLNKESASVESLRPSPHRCQLPPTSPARNTMAPPESPLRVGNQSHGPARALFCVLHAHACMMLYHVLILATHRCTSAPAASGHESGPRRSCCRSK